MDRYDSAAARFHSILISGVQVLGHICQCIENLHLSGYVHRDLKPGNMIWQPSTATWVLIDFGLCAEIGSTAVNGFTPKYATPEAVIAHISGERTFAADLLVDTWALGLIALELLLERSTYGWGTDMQTVRLLPSCAIRLGTAKSVLLAPFCR